jgi:hypothetical protein
MIVILVILLFVLLALRSIGNFYSGADEGRTPGPYRLERDNLRYWSEKSQERRDSVNRMLKRAGDDRRV